MSDNNVAYEYNGQEIEFNLQNKNVMVNASEMAKIFEKRPDVFMKADHVKAFIEEVKRPPYGGLLGINSDEDLFINRKSAGLWMHRILALKFAAWLDPKFEVWVYCKIDEILFGQAIQRKEILSSSYKLKSEIAQLEAELIENEKYKLIQDKKTELKRLSSDLKNNDNDLIAKQIALF